LRSGGGRLIGGRLAGGHALGTPLLNFSAAPGDAAILRVRIPDLETLRKLALLL
jgi:hypothetical protein